MGNSDCENIREKLDPYLDNELLVETNQSVLDHLGFCQDCAEELESRIELRRLLKAALNISKDDESDRDASSRKRTQMALARERGRIITARLRWMALAASVIVALTLGLVYWRSAKTPMPPNSSPIANSTSTPAVLIADVDRDAVENHQVCALSYPPNWAFDGQRVARDLTPSFAPLIDAIGRHHSSYELIEGHICSYQQRKYVHLIFRGDGHTISVFVESEDPGGKPKSSRPLEIDQAGYEAYQVASVNTGLHRIFVVSDLPGAENLALANQLVPATLGFIHQMELSAS